MIWKIKNFHVRTSLQKTCRGAFWSRPSLRTLKVWMQEGGGECGSLVVVCQHDIQRREKNVRSRSRRRTRGRLFDLQRPCGCITCNTCNTCTFRSTCVVIINVVANLWQYSPFERQLVTLSLVIICSVAMEEMRYYQYIFVLSRLYDVRSFTVK